MYLHLPTRGLKLAVDLFFIISGIVIAMMYDRRIVDVGSYVLFVRRRIARLYPLHIATLLFYVAIGVLVWNGKLSPINPEKYNAGEIVPNLLMVHAWSPFGQISFNYVSWSISAEFLVYLCFPLLLWLVGSGCKRGLAACAVLLAGAILVADATLSVDLTDLDWRLGAVRAVPSFSFGVWLWLYRDRLVGHPYTRFTAIAFAVSSAGLLACLVFFPSNYVMLALVYLVVASAFLCDLGGRWTLAAWKPLSSRGYLTYSVYMLHTVIATIVISFLFPRYFGRSDGVVLVAVICSVALTYLAALVSYRYFEGPLRALIGGKPPARLNSVGESKPRE
jgi:peptidoglycan/LPS O-acetylase OafA/YrhL